MLGIDHWGVWLAYLGCLLATILCVVYGALNWNRGDEPVQKDDVEWAEHEKKVEKEL